jgi:hypothetical protein
MRIHDIFENSGDDLFSTPRNELGKYIRAGQWASAAIQCIKLGYRNAQVEQSIIPGITRSERSGSVAGGAIWYDVRDWYQKFIAPNDWPELLQYVSSLKAKGPLNSALRHLVNFYADDNPQRTNEVYQLIVDKKAVDALVYFLGWPGNENMRRVPEMEPYIMTSPRAAMYYASNVLNARWPDAEPYIATDKVSWSMYAARALKTDNMTKAGRATRDAAQQEALSRLPAGHKKRIAEEDDMFATSNRSKVYPAIKSVLDGFYDHYQALYDQTDPEASEEWYVQLGEYLSDYDYLRSELARGGIPGFLNGLDMMSHEVVDRIDGELAIKHRVFLNQIEDEYLQLDEDTDEYDDDMFGSRTTGHPTYLLKAKQAREKYLQHENQFEKELRKLGQRLPQSWDGSKMFKKLSSDPKYAAALKHYAASEKYAGLAQKYEDLAQRKAVKEEDDMFSDNRVVINPRTLSNITHQLSRRYHKYAGTSAEQDSADMYHSEAYVLERASNAFLNGLRAGIKELEDLEDSTTWEDLDELAADFNINLSALMDKYDEGGITESNDDDMFAPSNKPNLQKISTDQLRMLHSLSKTDSRQEYASAHKLQIARIEAEMARRGLPMRTLDEDVNIPLGSQKGK